MGWHKHTQVNGYFTIVFTILRCCITIRASCSVYDATGWVTVGTACGVVLCDFETVFRADFEEPISINSHTRSDSEVELDQYRLFWLMS